MKTKVLLMTLLAYATLIRADEPKGAQTLVGAQALRAQQEQKRPAVTPPKQGTPPVGKRVGYGGYFTEVVRSERKRPFFNLRTPVDPTKDLDNLWFYPGTEKVQGVVLFSIKF